MQTLRSVTRARARMCSRSKILGLLATAWLLGCSGLEPVAEHEPITDPTQLYARLTLNHGVATLSSVSPYNEMQLMATPRNALGEPMTGLPAPTFTSSDTASVKVSSTGLVTARKTATNIRIIASLGIEGNARHADTLLVTVNNLATPPMLQSISIDPVFPDSALLWLLPPAHTGINIVPSSPTYAPGAFLQPAAKLSAHGTDMMGAVIIGLPAEYWSLDSTIATVHRRSGEITRLRPGQVRLVAQIMAYGVVQADTAVFTVTGFVAHSLTIKRSPTGEVVIKPSEVEVLPYGHIFWLNELDVPVEVTFDDPANVMAPHALVCSAFIINFIFPGGACEGMNGNITIPGPVPERLPPFTAMEPSIRARQFPVSGAYRFRAGGATGKIIVAPGPATS